jgi:hypothetical protein
MTKKPCYFDKSVARWEKERELLRDKTKRAETSKTYILATEVAHFCNPTYLGGWDREDQGSRPAWANSS